MGVSFNISWQGKRYMPNDAVYVRVCPCMRVCPCVRVCVCMDES